MNHTSLVRSTFAAWLIALAGAGCGPAAADDADTTDAEGDDSVEAGVKAQASEKLGADGKLAYTADARGDKIPDFSFVGYHGGGVF